MGACSTFSEDSLLSEIAVTRGITGNVFASAVSWNAQELPFVFGIA
jgi:hypothetical protein